MHLASLGAGDRALRRHERKCQCGKVLLHDVHVLHLGHLGLGVRKEDFGAAQEWKQEEDPRTEEDQEVLLHVRKLNVHGILLENGVFACQDWQHNPANSTLRLQLLLPAKRHAVHRAVRVPIRAAARKEEVHHQGLRGREEHGHEHEQQE